MKYQVVFQFPEGSLNYDEVIQLENELISAMGEHDIDGHDIDGHDIGAGEINYFIFTDHPNECLAQGLKVFGNRLQKEMKAAYRENEKSTYQILFPTTLRNFKVS